MGVKRCQLATRCVVVGLEPFCLEDRSLIYTVDIPGTHATLNQLEKKGPLVASEVALVLEGCFIDFNDDPEDTRRDEWAETLVGSSLYKVLVEESAKVLSLRGPTIEIVREVGLYQ